MREKVFKWLQTLNEDELQALLADLLRAMNYERVSVTHGPLEFGRDLVFHETDKLGRKIWRGIQAKVTSLSGSLASATGLRSVLQQCEAALDTVFITSSGEEVTLQEIWIVTTRPITENAKHSAIGKLRTTSSSIYLIDGSQLSDLVAQYLPELEGSKSKSIEAYIEKLVELCDSVEQYVSYRFNTKFSLSDVYIPSKLNVQLASIDSIKTCFPLPIVNQLDGLEHQAEEWIFLSQRRLLPVASHFYLADVITRLRDVINVISKLHWNNSNLEDIFRKLSKVSSAFGIQPFVSSGAVTNPTEYKYRHSVSGEKLSAVENELMNLKDQEVKVLTDYNEIKNGRPGSNPREFYALLERRRAAREKFFHDLYSAYIGSINKDDKMTQIAQNAAHFLFVDSVHPTPSKKGGEDQNLNATGHEARQDLRSLRELVDAFQGDFVRRVDKLWSTLKLAITEKRYDELLGPNCMPALVELEQLSRFLLTYNLMPDKACIKIEFNALDLCLRAPKLIVLGNLGQGKTTLLKQVIKRTVTELGSDSESDKTLPILCTLATLKNPAADVTTEFFIRGSHAGLEALNLSSGRIALMLDGFDEIADAEFSDKILKWFSDHNADSSQVLMSSRPDAIPTYVPEVMTARLLPFSKNEIEQFIRAFPWENANDADNLIDVMKGAPELLELASTPLLLTIIVIVAQRWGFNRLPKRKEGLYKLILDLLFGEWDAAKGVRRPQAIDDDFLRLRILKKVAFRLYAEGRRSFTREEFVNAVTSSHGSKVRVDEAVRFFGRLIRDCIILPLSKDSYGFFHFSIQEYLAAEDLCDDVNPNRVFESVQKFFSQPGWWEEVLVFYAGLKRDIGGVLEELHKKSFPAFAPGHSPISNEVELNPDFIRLITRMIKAADETDFGSLNARGSVAWAFAKLNIADKADYWRRMAQSPW